MTKKHSPNPEQTSSAPNDVQTENALSEEKALLAADVKPNTPPHGSTAKTAENTEQSPTSTPKDAPNITDKEQTVKATDKNDVKNDRTFRADKHADDTTHGNRGKENDKTETVVVKKGGSVLALLALLVALGVGAAGYYFGGLQIARFEQKLIELEQTRQQAAVLPEMPDFNQERIQITQLEKDYRTAANKIELLEKELSARDQSYAALQSQINKLNSSAAPVQPNDWLLSEADFLLTNALRRLLLDNDVDTGIALLKVADETLAKVSDPRAVSVRTAINSDLKQLLSVNNVDQNAIMQRLSQLANNVDELSVLDVDFGGPMQNDKVSDNVADWETNLEKSANSFLNHFIRITPRNAKEKALLAPNQDVYLRENIRLRLQIAILAVPRQQNELYKQSLEAVASWVRSYFDTTTEDAVNFLQTLDELAEQSIYVDVPNQLNSLNVLDKILNKSSAGMQKIELSVDKALTPETESKGAEPPAPARQVSSANGDAQQ